MMADIVISRSDLVGCSKSRSIIAETLVRNNALNLTGRINYNASGVKDGIGFESVTDKFVDNFILRVLVPDYNLQKGKNIFIGSQNKSIRDLLDAFSLKNCIVKAVAFTKLKKEPPKNTLDQMPFRDIEKVADHYFYQEFKIACPNLEYNSVMNFIRNAPYSTIGMFIKDIDVTMDYAGSFDKDEVIDHLTANEGFREQGTCEEALRTIINNDSTVGNNCLTYMETIAGITIRQKIYNKMVQMLECKSVRSSVGCHWKDWVCQKDTRLATARDKSSHRGCTRAEATFYINTVIPTDDFIEDVLHSIVKYVPKSLVYTTPFSATWKVYCDTFTHSLVCIDRHEDIGIIVYSYNELTHNISGQAYEKWSEREKWCLDKLTLNGNIPLDIIEVNTISKTSIDDGKRKDDILEISGGRYYKINHDSSTNFTTRLVSKGGVYSCNNESIEHNIKLLEKAGFLEHENCVPYLAKSKGTNKSKADAVLRKVDTSLRINVLGRKAKRVVNLDMLKEKLCEEAKEIEEIRTPLLIDLQQKENKIKVIKEYKKRFQQCGTTPLCSLKQGSFTVRVAKKLTTRFGSAYKLLVEDDDVSYIVWSNKHISDLFAEILQEKLVNVDNDFLFLDDKPLGVLVITGQGTNQYGKVSVYCTFTLTNVSELEQLGNDDTPRTTISREEFSDNEITTLPRKDLLPYREYENLISFPIGSVHQIDAIGYITHYGTPRLVLRIHGTIYQAGQDLEEKKDKIILGCSIKIEKIRNNKTRHIKYAICSIYEKGDWTAMTDYTKTPMLSKFDGSTCIVDVRTVDVKGTKRKLLLTNTGDVYKLKKSKLEQTIKPGTVVNIINFIVD